MIYYLFSFVSMFLPKSKVDTQKAQKTHTAVFSAPKVQSS